MINEIPRLNPLTYQQPQTVLRKDPYSRLISLERELGASPVQSAILRRAAELSPRPRLGRRAGFQRGYFLLRSNRKSWDLSYTILDRNDLRRVRRCLCPVLPGEAEQYLADRTIPERLRALSQPTVDQENAKIRAWIESGELTK